jgi:tRNA-specific 2-thiouridylase
MRVVVAMSGGVDSSVVAGLMAAAGHEVIGVTLQLYDHGAASGRKGACCAGQDIHDAKRVADRLGIAHYVIDAEQRFKSSVMAAFADSYAAGQTPVPCIACNQHLKFGDLLSMARDLGAEALATGHYVRRVDGPEGAELHQAADAARDQSWFLFATTRDQLDFCRFPLGEIANKAEVRGLAARMGLEVAEKPDSQDICFVPSGSYAEIVGKFRPDALEAGEIVTAGGETLGMHQGIARYTVGQAKRLGNAVQPADRGGAAAGGYARCSAAGPQLADRAAGCAAAGQCEAAGARIAAASGHYRYRRWCAAGFGRGGAAGAWAGGGILRRIAHFGRRIYYLKFTNSRKACDTHRKVHPEMVRGRRWRQIRLHPGERSRCRSR